ncbi:sensor histidine kinase [Nocardioides sp. T2.26MG-1]|uniref:sensor histidine kinase n=1 Tax=Nocardioides sp. T2.26MG-1 TaxID=3041166 RepID=UPI00247788AF|nr:PAS domain-containing sensor histidine kinase [Nocardioides sp. T2.26MG-1]CAI9401888.1 Adaptive-response sensory-kinase SasA [Nocardioides sp. T2.26MG-1]
MDGNATFQRALRVLLWIDGEPDPRVLQAGFTALVVLDRLLRRAGGVPLGPGNWPLRGGAVAILLLLVVVSVPRAWRTRSAISVLAVADIAVVGVSSLSPEDGGAGLLVVLPALWLGSQYGVRGVFVGMGTTFSLVTVPALATHGFEGEALSRLIPLPLVAGVGALAISASLDAARAALARAEDSERRLSGTLALLEAERQTSHDVFDAVDVGLMLLDRDGALVGMNRQYEVFTRLAFPDEATPWPGDCYAADGRTPLRGEEMPSARAARGEEFDDYRIWVGSDPWTRRALSVSARRALDESGELVGAALASADITDLMQALDVKDAFVATVSHELRTPLTSIAGYVSILLEEEDDLPEWVESKLRVVDRNTKRLTALVEALLQEAHHVDGLLPLSPRETDVAQIVETVVRAAGPVASACGVGLEFDGPSAALVVADPRRIGQLVDNLVSNAIKFTPSGGLVRAIVGFRDGGVELRVADTGIGIAPPDIERLFTRFYRTRAATEAAIQGVGLGLSLTKAIVDSHGGRIEVDSTVGRGSEFRVWLPAGSHAA